MCITISPRMNNFSSPPTDFYHTSRITWYLRKRISVSDSSFRPTAEWLAFASSQTKLEIFCSTILWEHGAHSGNIKRSDERERYEVCVSKLAVLSRTMNIKLLVESATAAVVAAPPSKKESAALNNNKSGSFEGEEWGKASHVHIMIHAQWLTERIIRSLSLSLVRHFRTSHSHSRGLKFMDSAAHTAKWRNTQMMQLQRAPPAI